MKESFCDCGAIKRPESEACDRCAFLDGVKSGESLVIGAFRTFGGKATPADLASFTGLGAAYIYRILRSLREARRVRRVGTETYVFESSWSKPNQKTQIYYELTA